MKMMKFPSINKYVKDGQKLVKSNEHSRKQQHIPEIISKYSGGIQSGFKSRKHILHKMVGCLLESKKSASSITKNPQNAKRIISDEDFKELESYIKNLGISDIGYTKVKRKHIFKDEVILFDNAIVITLEMKREAIQTAPSKTAITEIFRTYYDLGVTVNKISTFLRKRGYNAMAGPAIGGSVSYVPLAQDAGLGVIGKHGLLISDKNYGPSLRIAAVYTDIENLPLADENPHMWVRLFCDQCNRCVKACPAGAIYEKSKAVPEDSEGYQSIDVSKCAVPFANNYGCTVCIKKCTFFKTDYEKIHRAFVKKV